MDGEADGIGWEVGAAGFGMLAIIAYVIVDSFAGRKKALWSALGLGVVEVAFSLIVAGLDYITLLSFVIVGVFVLISLKTDNDYYFKVSWALVSLLTGIAIAVVTWGFGKNLFFDMFEKYGFLDMFEKLYPPDIPFRSFLFSWFGNLGKQLPFWLFLHAGIVFLAAKKNKWIWVIAKVGVGSLLMLIAAILAMIPAFLEHLRGI